MPFGSSKAAMMGAAGAGGGVELSGGTEFQYGGKTFMKFTSSGTLTVSGSGLVDYLIVGGGGGGGSCSGYGGGGGGGGGGIVWGSNYLLDSSYRETFAVSIGAGGSGSDSHLSYAGGNTDIGDWGKANDSTNFDWNGGTSYTSTADKAIAAGGGGGAQGQWGVCNAGGPANPPHGSSQDWGSSGGPGGGGGWVGYCGGGSGSGSNHYYRYGSSTGSSLSVYTIKSQNSDGSIADHYVSSSSNYSISNQGTYGLVGTSMLGGDVSSPVPIGPSGNVTATVNIDSNNRGFEWHDGVRYGTAGAAAVGGDWYNSADGGGRRGTTNAGDVDGAPNQGGGGFGRDAGYMSIGGDGGSGIFIVRIL